jgi:L-ascorbate metabolism protein UlaG (beta-lactamase superfamily)
LKKTLKFLRKMLIILLFAVLILSIAVFAFMQQAKFGATPQGERLELMKKSPHYKDGKFHNLSPTPDLTEGVTYYSVLKEFLFEKKERLKPIDIIPSQKTDLKQISKTEDALVWFGHSSYFMQIDGKRILVDPVLSGAASPISFTTPSFKGTDIYTVTDFPAIDYLFISHDHWDHLDYETVTQFLPKVSKVLCGLGVGAHLEAWGYKKENIIEKDWHEEVILEGDWKVNFAPARHFSGRGFSRNGSLWVSFVLKTPHSQIFIGGDSGYDAHFKEIGKKFGTFDLAIIECGQYDKSWKYIHLLPDEIVKATEDLNAKVLFPVHWGKFNLANHAWDASAQAITTLSEEKNYRLITPMIGEQVRLQDSTQVFSKWWEKVR